MNLSKSIYFFLAGILFRVSCLFRGGITYSGGIRRFGSRIRVEDGGLLTLGKGITLIRSSITVKRGGKIEIGDNASFHDVDIVAEAQSDIRLHDGVVMRHSRQSRGSVHVESGTMHIQHHANLASSIHLRFNSRLEIGEYTSMGPNGEIVCDERIHIGDYCLISSEVDIYDTNSHSVDHSKRRERIRAGYPVGCSEVEKPDTQPISIGDDVWIGKGSAILKGAAVGDRCIVGMATKVTSGEYPPDSVIVSDKAKAIAR